MGNPIQKFIGLRKEIYILFLGKLVTAMGSFVWPMITLFLSAKLGFEPYEITIVMAIVTILSLPASIIGGTLTDRIGRKKIIIYFDLVTITLFFIAAMVEQSIYTVVLVAISGLFQTAEGPAYDALVSDFSSTEQREKAFSSSYFGYNLGFVLGASVSGILFANYYWLSFILNAVAIGTSTILIFFFIDEKKRVKIDLEQSAEDQDIQYGTYEKPMDENKSIYEVLKGRGIIYVVMIASCLSSLVYSTVGLLLPLQLEAQMGVGEGAKIYGFLSSFNGLVVIIATPLVTIYAKKIRELGKIIIGISLYLLGIYFFGFYSGTVYLFIAMFSYTLGEVVVTIGKSPYISKRIPSSHRGRIFGFMSVIATIFSASSTLLAGFILQATGNNYQFVWSIYIGIGIFTILIFLLCYKKDKKTFPDLFH